MRKSTGRSWPRRSTGTVTVIEAHVHHSSERNAKLGFFVTLFVVGLISATILADRMPPVLGLFAGAALGMFAGALVWALVRVWPVIRLLWWWATEIILAVTIVYGWTGLARHTTLPVRLVLVALLVGVPAAVPWLRHRIKAVAWCVIVRHRLRVCFSQFIIANRSGSLPLILLGRPTNVGERVWVLLRPGLCLADLEARLDKIAVACQASMVTVERANEGNAAYLRLDIKRRNALKVTVGSPLVDLVHPDTPTADLKATEVPTALDLPQVPEVPGMRIKVNPSGKDPANGRKPASTAASVTGLDGEDVSDWID